MFVAVVVDIDIRESLIVVAPKILRQDAVQFVLEKLTNFNLVSKKIPSFQLEEMAICETVLCISMLCYSTTRKQSHRYYRFHSIQTSDFLNTVKVNTRKYLKQDTAYLTVNNGLGEVELADHAEWDGTTTWLGIVQLTFEEDSVDSLLLSEDLSSTGTGWSATDNGDLVLHLQ